MNKNLLIGIAAAGAIGTAASATTFTGSLSVAALDSDPGLAVKVADTASFSVDLNEGESYVFDAFGIYTDESWVNWEDDLTASEIVATFTFTDPEALVGDVVGTTRGRYLRQDGIVEWDGPLVFTFGPGDSGQFTVALTDTVFSDGCLLCGTAPGYEYRGIVEGELTYDVEPVPLPAGGLLLIGGLGGLAYLRRRMA